MTRHQSAVVSEARYLQIEQWFEDGAHHFAEFDDPRKLAMASEGFCPFRVHKELPGEADIAVALERREDGMVFCSVDKVLMRFTWLDVNGAAF